MESTLSGMIRMAAQGARDDGAIDEIEEQVLGKLADLLSGWSLEDLSRTLNGPGRAS